MSVYLTVHFLKAMTADELALEQNHIVSVAAKQASRFVFFENNLVLVNENFNRILVFNIHFVAAIQLAAQFCQVRQFCARFPYFS